MKHGIAPKNAVESIRFRPTYYLLLKFTKTLISDLSICFSTPFEVATHGLSSPGLYRTVWRCIVLTSHLNVLEILLYIGI